jgi:hypothetical protein
MKVEPVSSFFIVFCMNLFVVTSSFDHSIRTVDHFSPNRVSNPKIDVQLIFTQTSVRDYDICNLGFFFLFLSFCVALIACADVHYFIHLFRSLLACLIAFQFYLGTK